MRTVMTTAVLACLAAAMPAHAQHAVSRQAAPLATLAAPPPAAANDSKPPRSVFGAAMAEMTRSMRKNATSPAADPAAPVAARVDNADDADAPSAHAVASGGN